MHAGLHNHTNHIHCTSTVCLCWVLLPWTIVCVQFDSIAQRCRLIACWKLGYFTVSVSVCVFATNKTWKCQCLHSFMTCRPILHCMYTSSKVVSMYVYCSLVLQCGYNTVMQLCPSNGLSSIPDTSSANFFFLSWNGQKGWIKFLIIYTDNVIMYAQFVYNVMYCISNMSSWYLLIQLIINLVASYTLCWSCPHVDIKSWSLLNN